jgi:hypothetical protein
MELDKCCVVFCEECDQELAEESVKDRHGESLLLCESCAFSFKIWDADKLRKECQRDECGWCNEDTR